MQKNKLIFFTLFLAFLLALTSFAFEENSGSLMSESCESSGYIVKVRCSEASLCSEGTDCDADIAEYVLDEYESTSDIAAEHSYIKVDDEETLKELVEQGLVDYYEPDYLMYLCGYDYTLNPMFSNQWGHGYINSQFAWNAGVFGNGVRVGVIDSGVYPNNDIVNNLDVGYNFLTNTTDTTDNIYHGTAVAGIIAAQCNDMLTVGLAHRATIVPLKVTDDSSVKMSYVISAIYAGVDTYDCDVLNLSIGSSNNTTGLSDAVNYAITKGVIVVASAGNGNSTDYSYPASYDAVISVANAAKSGTSAVISSSSQRNDMVDVAAPGTSVCSLSNSASGACYVSGTSFSSPYVAAAAALCKGLYPDLTPTDFQKLVERSADSSYLTEDQGSHYWGAGMLDVEALMKEMFKAMGHTDYYVSAVDEQIYGDNTSVYFTNLLSSDVTYTAFVTNKYGTMLNGLAVKSMALASNESFEISLTADALGSSLSVILLDEKMRPVFTEPLTFTLE